MKAVLIFSGPSADHCLGLSADPLSSGPSADPLSSGPSADPLSRSLYRPIV